MSVRSGNSGQRQPPGSESEVEREIVAQLRALSESDNDFWTFRKAAARPGAHGLSQYPAMMVPPMQATLMRVVSEVDGRIRTVVDPFLGSGTTLTESMRLGLDYAGQDINPLAVLFSRTKAGPFHTDRLRSAARRVLSRVRSDRRRAVDIDFPGLDKWFCPYVATKLSRLRRAIRSEPNLWCRRTFWTALAETVRLTSNSRTSTFKLHVRSKADLESRNLDPIAVFADRLDDIVMRLADEGTALKQAGHVTHNGWYRGNVTIRLGDVAGQEPHATVEHDLLVTSPPYGDNTSTVPYGQYSYLPLQWIDLADIDDAADSEFLRSTYEIDRRSLGGRRPRGSLDIQDVLEKTPTLRKTLHRLLRFPRDRAQRVAAYFRDLDATLHPIVTSVRAQGYMIWTVGNRRVGGEPVPTDAIVTELLAAQGVRRLLGIARRIPNKRMATRNNIASTMRGESILIFRKS